MITPFGPPHEDLDRLNTILDAQVAGKRAPETGPASDADALAATARLVSGQPIDAKEHASAETLDEIWRNVMHAHAIPGSTVITGARPAAVRSTNRVQEIPGPDGAARSSWLSVAAVAVLLLGIVGGAWSMRGGSDGGDDPIRLAAVAPLGTPEPEAGWLSWIRPEECTAEPMSTEEYAEVMREEPDISGRSYEVVGPADPETAKAVASVAREYEACSIYGGYRQERSLKTDASIFFDSYSADRTITNDELYKTGREHLKLLSATLSDKEPGAYAVIIDDAPPSELMKVQLPSLTPRIFFSFAYDPDNAVTLADGRVVLPATILYWSGDESGEWLHVEQWQIDESTQLSTIAVILAQEDGRWKVDEDGLILCPLEGCAAYWTTESLATPAASPIATPEG